MKQAFQAVFLTIHKMVRRSGLLDTGVGRSVFEACYDVYKARCEAGEIAGLRRYVTPGSTVFDIGANIGFFTVRFARWVSQGGRVIAVEPEEGNFRRLEARLARAKLSATVDLIRAVVAERTGEMLLEINPDHPGDHRIGERGTPVPAVTIDSLSAAAGWPPVSMLKIDVQGAEARVIAGAAATLERFAPAIWMEVDPQAMARMGTTAAALLGLMEEVGYRPHRLGTSGPGDALSAAEVMTAVGAEGYIDCLFLPCGRNGTGAATGIIPTNDRLQA